MNPQPPTSAQKRSSRRRLFVVMLACLLLPTCVLLLYPGRRIDSGGFNDIQDGMTENEVEAILGCPPGDYTYSIPLLRPKVTHKNAIHSRIAGSGTGGTQRWIGPVADITVSFDKDGKVVRKSITESPSLLEEVKRKLF